MIKPFLLITLTCLLYSHTTIACNKCTAAAEKAVEQCQACIAQSKACYTATAKVFQWCPLCKSQKSTFDKRCKTAIVFCNRLIAECKNLSDVCNLDSRDKYARNDCKHACKKATAQCKKLASLCAKNSKTFAKCPRTSKKDTSHPDASTACTSCEQECEKSQKSFAILMDALVHCKKR